MWRYRWQIFWAAAVLLLFFCNGQLLITDSVESNYALTAKEMVLSGDWVSPQIYGKYWYDKPVLFYWLTAIAFKVFGFNEFAARLFPSLFGLAGLGFVAWTGKKLFNERVGFCAAVVLLTSVEFFLISKSIITDSILFLFMSMTLVGFYLGYSSSNKNYYYLLYLGAALATLTKGPIGFLLPGLIIVIFLTLAKGWSALRTMRLFSGSLLFIAVAVPWYALMISLHGNAFVDTFFGTHNFLRATVSEHPRDNVWYYYTAVLALALFPWSALLPKMLFGYVYKNDEWVRPQGKVLFLLVWASVVFFFFQNMATKYLTYTYPMLFPLALLLGDYVETHHRSAMLIASSEKGHIQSVFDGVKGFVKLGYAALISVVGWLWWSGRIVPSALMAALVLIALGLTAIVLLGWARGKILQEQIVAVGAFVFIMALIPAIAVPLSNQRSAKYLAYELQTHYPQTQEIGLYGNYPTSAVFYCDKRIVLLVNEQEAKSFAPRAYSWNSKHVMPFATINNFEQAGGVVAVQKAKLNSFSSSSENGWAVEHTDGEWFLLRQS